MIKVLVGSQNPIKIEATKEAFLKYFNNVEVIGIKVNSKVSDQPINTETFEGAKNRALELKKINEEKELGAKFFVGIEGGIIKLYERWFAFGGICIINDKGRISYGTSPLFELPKSIVKDLLNGIELGVVIDKITGEHNTKQKQGAIGFFTKGIINRKGFYVDGIIVALIPFINEEFYLEYY
jgi:inosine/xanthosine triphosphatase